MRNIHPVEELFEIRAEIRALKAREAELRAFFLDRAGQAERRGPFHEVAVVEQTSRVLDRARLPRAVLEDPGLWRTRRTTQVRLLRRSAPPECHAFAPPARRPGGSRRTMICSSRLPRPRRGGPQPIRRRVRSASSEKPPSRASGSSPATAPPSGPKVTSATGTPAARAVATSVSVSPSR